MFLLKLLLKNPLRHKLRTVLTVIGIAIAILAFGMLRTVVSAWYAGVEASSASRLMTRNAISIIFSLPISYKEKIRQVDGVSIVSWANWFGGIYIDEKNLIANFAVDPESYLRLYPEYVLTPEQEKAFIRDRKGFIAGRKLVQKYGWKIGDTITLKGTIFPGNWDMTMRGIYRGRYKSTDETQLIFHWDYLNETLKKTVPRRADQVGFFMIGIKNPDQAAQVAENIDKTFKNSLAETLTETEKAFQLDFIAMTEAIVIAIQLVSFVVIIIIMAVTANTMAMTARERIGEYAVLKTLGFSWPHLVFLIAGESLFISMLGTAAGIAVTFPAAHAFADKMGTFFPVFNIERKTIWLDVGAGALVGVVAAAFPAWRAARIRIAEGLRRIG